MTSNAMTSQRLLASLLQTEVEALGCMLTFDECHAIVGRLFDRMDGVADGVNRSLEARIARLKSPPQLRLVDNGGLDPEQRA